MNRIWKAACAILMIGSLSSHAESSSSPSRAVALKWADESIAKVRKNLASDPEAVEDYLVWQLARPIGDDPRVLALCKEVVEGSTSTANARVVMAALNVINQWHPASRSQRSQQKEQIAGILNIIMARPDRQLRDGAAHLLGTLGDRYAAQAGHYYSEILKSPASEGETDFERRNAMYRSAIRELIALDRRESYPLIREVTRKYNLLDAFKKWIAEDSPKRLTWEGNEAFLRKWEALMSDKR